MVSVVIPVYNNPFLILEMIDCVINQSYNDWELIVVDDCSVDDTFEVMKEYCKADNRIQIIQRDRLPKGAPTCRNIGLQKARGEYIVFFDSDDLIPSTCLQNRVEFMEENREIDFGVFKARSFHNILDLQFHKLNKFDYSIELESDKNEILKGFLTGEYPFLVWTNIYRRSKLINGDIYWDESLAVFQDLDFNCTVLLNNLNCLYAKSIEYDYFVRINHNSDSISSNLSSDLKFKSVRYFIEKTINSLKRLPNGVEYENDFFGFALFYLNRIVHDKRKVKEYIIFCQRYFPKNKLFRLRSIVFLTYVFHSKTISFRYHRYLQNVFFIERYLPRMVKYLRGKVNI